MRQDSKIVFGERQSESGYLLTRAKIYTSDDGPNLVLQIKFGTKKIEFRKNLIIRPLI